MKFKSRVTKITVIPEACGINDERATHIEVADEGAGEFLEFSQCNGHECKGQCIALDKAEWETIKFVADQLFEEIEDKSK